MIQLEHLHVEEFRGIRSIDLPLGSKPFVVHGPNGSGKSGIVDAIDFALTGGIRRLTGAGTGGVTVTTHGPHVHHRNNPRAAVVRLTVRDIDSGEIATITRSVAKPELLTLEPEVTSIKKALEFVQVHPELTLTRREIIKFVVAQPTSRAEEIQALLKLDRLAEYRKLLRTTQTQSATAANSATTERNSAETALRGHLNIDDLLVSEIERTINRHRSILGVPPITDLTMDTDLLEDTAPDHGAPDINLSTAIRETSALVKRIETLTEVDGLRLALQSELDRLAAEPGIEQAIKHRAFYTSGLALVIDERCPLCAKEWPSVEALRKHIQEQVALSARASEMREAVASAANKYRTAVTTLRAEISQVSGYAARSGTIELKQGLATWNDELAGILETLRDVEVVLANSESFQDIRVAAPALVTTGLTSLQSDLRNEPDQSARMASYTFLTVANERRNKVRLARVTEAQACAARDAAQTVYRTYCEVMDRTLTELYEEVEAEFSSFYRLINSDDEGEFSAQLTPSSGSLDFQVNFYGQGMFPPTAYHSEGHQDGMGVCLYLALVKQLLGDDFRFAVLDDVVMSVDVNHRKQFCRLLRTAFPNVQFIITTHDEVWARQMQSEGLIGPRNHARFYGWSIGGGPLYEQGEIWDRIDADIADGDVSGAAHKLRRRLEAAAADIAEAIGGRVGYRGDGNYQLADLLAGIKGRHSELLKQAAAAAQSWKNEKATQDVAAKKVARANAVPELENEQWAINALVHNNDWAQMSPADFRPVLDSVRDFLALFRCDNPECGGWIYTVGFPPDTLRCSCGQYLLNLKKRPAGA